MTPSVSKSYSTFNTVTFEANVFNVDLVDGQYGEYAAITLIGNFSDDDGGFTIKFNNSNGLVKLAKNGKLMNGRRLIVTGRIESVAQVYFDKKDGQTKMLKRPQITLDSRTVQVNLGPLPASARTEKQLVGAGAPIVDQTPDLPGEVQDYGANTATNEDGSPLF